jgi:patatin-like phospholipase/acyl hydrolase
VIPATVLKEIEERTEQPASGLFDVIAGTSTGGILALGLSCPKPGGGGPRFNAGELLELYRQEGPRIFPHEFSGRFRQLLGPKYSDRGRHGVLRERFKGARLSEALTDVLITNESATLDELCVKLLKRAGRPLPPRYAGGAVAPAPKDPGPANPPPGLT